MNSQETIFTYAWKAYMILCGGDATLAWGVIIVVGLAVLHLGTTKSESNADPCDLGF